jgi:hypothetical protein
VRKVEHVPRVVADPDAVAFAAEHGGRVYVWAGDGGFKHVKTQPPDDARITFNEYVGSGLTLCAAADALPPERTWNVVLRKVPHHHLDVLWDGHEPGWAMVGSQ